MEDILPRVGAEGAEEMRKLVGPKHNMRTWTVEKGT
jgi:hypothetical protein